MQVIAGQMRHVYNFTLLVSTVHGRCQGFDISRQTWQCKNKIDCRVGGGLAPGVGGVAGPKIRGGGMVTNEWCIDHFSVVLSGLASV